MINVMIVDDEPLVRITLKSIIPWEKFGFYLVEEAENGKQCLEILQKQKVDIIITDIRMPVIDGLELINIVKKNYPDILIVVLSAYEEFDLVKRSLLSGAEDYILKSEINESSTKKVLLSIKEKYEKNSSKHLYEMNLQKSMTENIEVLRVNFLKELISNSMDLDEKQIAEKIQQYEISLNRKHLFLVIMKISETSSEETVLEKVIKNFINELFKKEPEFICFISNKMEVVIIRSYSEYKSDNNIYQKVSEDVSRAASCIKKFLNIDVTTAVSKKFDSFSKLNGIYNKTKELLNYSFPLGKGNIFYEQNFEKSNLAIDLERINSLSDDFRASIDKLEFRDAKTYLNNITLEFTEHYSNENYITLKHYCKLLTAIVDKSIELSLYNNFFYDKINPYEYILNSHTIYIVENYLSGLLDSFEECCGVELKTQYGFTIGKVMNYVLKNYHKDINLNKVAEELKFNASYLSAKFKETTKHSFNEYLNSVRISNAKKLMAERKYKINQIAEMVGYNDQKYFSKIFKNIVGTTPREYVESLSFL